MATETGSVKLRKLMRLPRRRKRDTNRGNSIEISLYLFIYMVRRTSFSVRASNYVKWAELSVKSFETVTIANGHQN